MAMRSLTLSPASNGAVRLAVLSMLVLAALVIATAPVRAKIAPRIDVKEHFYDIKGHDIDSLRAQMRNLGPFSPQREGHVPARMEAKVDFRFKARWRRGRCRISSVRVHARITYHFPRWTGLQNAEPELADKWRDYMTSLIVHEEGHGKLVIKAAKDVEAALKATPSSRSCRTVRKRARRRGANILTEMKKAQAQYDIDTRGGASQGATFRNE